MDFKISAVDLFCGVGGLTHGLMKAGIPVKAGIDFDGTCKYAYEKNNEAQFIESDIQEVKAEDINKYFGKSDIKVLVGCAPCQCFSKHTQKLKNREKDKKWGLLNYFSKLISEIEPDIISMENVAEIRNHKIFYDFVEALERMQYNIFHDVIYCPDYGIPQKRRRLVLLASKFGEINIIPKTHSPEKYKTVQQTIGKLENIKDGEASTKDKLHRAWNLTPLNKKRIKQSVPGGTWLDWDEELRTRCHRKESGNTYSSVYGRMRWDNPSPTITTQFFAYGTGRFGHPEQNRALSLREGALLQTFPRYYDLLDPKMKMSFGRIGTHIGNAVPPRLGYIIGKSITKHIEECYEEK